MQTDGETDRHNANRRFKMLFGCTDSSILLALRGRKRRMQVRKAKLLRAAHIPTLTSQR